MPECGQGQSNCRGSSFNKKRKKKKRKLINTGTWNVRTLTSIGKLHLLLQVLTECNMNITGLCETRWSGEGHFSSGERTIMIIQSGKEKGGSHIRDNGQDTRTVSALRRQKEKATHWPALCHKLNMKTNNKERSDSPAPTETPGERLTIR
ncbi:craniofacial development protein 2-like [Elysia marginata]|uniref:Craniofacial development protein 2-like n=1 Tax=Elysia marginata TaxID=1093978 RepID=A0AAV4JGG7_9GAST|nr:craniofacial development protein 2-like [Elysia marginata]